MGMTRRRFLAGTALSAAAGLLESPGPAMAGDSRPNILFIVVDDLNDWPSPFANYPGIVTPNFARLAERGMVFRHAYCPAPVCNASRAAVLSGISPARSGIYDNDTRWQDRIPDAVTLPEAFRAAGYRTVGSGKVFHGYYAYPPFDRTAETASWLAVGEKPEAWSLFWPMPDEPLPRLRPASGLPLAGPQFDWSAWPERDEDLPDMRVAQFIASLLRQPATAPLFVAAGLYRPHLPWYVPRRFLDLYPLDRVGLPEIRPDDLEDIPPVGRAMAASDLHRKIVESGRWREAIRAYLASISLADHCLGLLLDALDQGPHARNTFVVLWSDNGWHLGEKLHWRKFALWERATHVPFLMAGPGIARGAVCDQPLSLIDLYPTLCDLAGVPLPAGPEGRSLQPLLRDPTADWPYPAVMTWLPGNHAIRHEQWRYIRYRDGSEELYDHASDSQEHDNLAANPAYNAICERLRSYVPRD